MLRGVYSSASGMLMEMDKVSMHAGNISNAQTSGYKRREMSAVPFKELMISVIGENGKSLKLPVGTGSGSSFMQLDDTQGSLRSTGGALDLAFQGQGYFVMQRNGVEGIPGQYTTRSGKLMLDNDGYIINPNRDYLLDENMQKIKLEVMDGKTKLEDNDKRADSLSQRLSIKDNGELYDSGQKVATIAIKTDTNIMGYIPQLKIASYSQDIALKTNNMPVDKLGREIRVKQGYLEGSNVQIISEMVGMMHAAKSYESGHKLIMSEDKILDKAINEMGRTG